ncbi:MAG: hypothetical protein ACM3SP_14255 [Chloroflexota bacterium]
MPTWIVRFDDAGQCTSPKTMDAVLDLLSGSAKPSHVIFMSHGWNSDFADATSQYGTFLQAFEKVVTSHPPATTYKPLFIGVTWPSVWFPFDEGPRLAGPEAERTLRVGGLKASAHGRDDVRMCRFEDLLSKDQLSQAELNELAEIVEPVMASVDESDVKPQTDLDSNKIAAAAKRVQAVVRPAS